MNRREGGFLMEEGRPGRLASGQPREPVARLLVFNLDQQRYGLDLSRVARIFRAFEITRLPKVPEIILGLINVQGEVIPVVSLRKRFCLPERPLELDERLIIARTLRRPVALLVDTVSGVIEQPKVEVILPEAILPGLEFLRGVVKLPDGMILIQDLDKLLSLEEEKQLDDAIHAEV